MKTKLSFFGSLLICFLITYGAQAIPVFQDSFPYAAGPIDIVSGGNATAGGGVWVSGAGSLYGTTGDIICDGSGDLEIMGSGTSDLPKAYFTNGIAGFTYPAVPLFTNTVYYFLSNAPVAGLYAGFNLMVDFGAFSSNKFAQSTPYIAYFADTNFDFAPRIFVTTNGAAPGFFRVGIGGTGVTTGIFPEDLSAGNPYQIVVRYTISTGGATLWVSSSPINETYASVSPTGTFQLNGITSSDVSGNVSTVNFGTCAFGVRNASGDGPIYISQLAVGTSFADVVPTSDGQNPVFIQTQPQNTTNFAGQPATLSVVAGGDQDTMTYQWNMNGSPLTGATTSSLPFASLASGNQGTYSVTVANASTPLGITSATVNLTVLTSDVVPSISSQPTNLTVTAGSTATFSVTASDSGAPLSYQWYLGSTPIPSQTSSALAISSVVFSNAASYKVVITNPNGDQLTSSSATLVVNPPAPIPCTIQYLRSLLDTNFNTNISYFANGGLKLFTVTGTNTVWENLTTPGNSEFYIQDGTAGVTVFWSGAASASHMPPAGAVITVTAPISDFDGLLELAPVFTNTFHSVTWSNVGPLPTPLPLTFDQTIFTNGNYMQKHLVGEYFGATNVFLDQSTGPLFGNNANEPLTNDIPGSIVDSFTFYNATNTTKGTNFTVMATNVNGEVFNVIFYNNHTDLFGAVKPIGPVTIYGVMGIFALSTPYSSGYELTPSRLADIVPAVTISNVITNVVRHGDLATNSFSSTVLQPGETIVMTVVAHDPGGGTSTMSGLAGNGTWSAITGNGTATATATYTYTATVAAEGTADTPSLTASFSSSGFVGDYTNLNTIYVPTAAEQNMRISELFSAPTSNTNSPAYDPLNRPLPETGTISVNDQYIEMVNVNSNTAVNIDHWTLFSGFSKVYQFVLGETLQPNTCGIVYGGPSGTDNDPPQLFSDTLTFHENSGGGLSLSTNGGTFSLFNGSGYLIDRVSYPPQGSVVGSFSRFFTMNGQLVPQAWINTNAVTPGNQYDTGSWSKATTPPLGVQGVKVIYGNPVTLNFTATPGNVSTLWEANTLLDYFNVVNGQTFTNTAGTFSVTNPPPFSQFYFITTP